MPARRAPCCAARPSPEAVATCRISPLADLATRASTDGEWLAPVAVDAVVQAGFSATASWCWAWV